VIDPQPDHRAPAIVDVDGFPYIGIRDLRPDGTVNVDTARQVSEKAVRKQEESFTINNGDIVFCKVGTLGLPRLIRPHCRIALSATLVLLKPRIRKSSGFLRYALDSHYIYSQIELFSTGSTRSALGIEQIRKFILPWSPHINEQQAIADFLDRETAKIDALIEKKERLIELLKEKRTALISHAVTKGLDPNVPMKDSGIEWLGEIPAHWEVKRLKRLATINDEILLETTDPDFEISYVDIGSVDSTDGIAHRETYVFANAPSRARRIVRRINYRVLCLRLAISIFCGARRCAFCRGKLPSDQCE